MNETGANSGGMTPTDSDGHDCVPRWRHRKSACPKAVGQLGALATSSASILLPVPRRYQSRFTPQSWASRVWATTYPVL